MRISCLFEACCYSLKLNQNLDSFKLLLLPEDDGKCHKKTKQKHQQSILTTNLFYMKACLDTHYTIIFCIFGHFSPYFDQFRKFDENLKSEKNRDNSNKFPFSWQLFHLKVSQLKLAQMLLFLSFSTNLYLE